MFCIRCRSEHTKVTNSRPHKKRATIWRRRQCQSCQAVFTTIESIASEGLLEVMSSDGKTKVPFSIGRLLMNIAPLLTRQDTAADDAYWLSMTAYEQSLPYGQVITTHELSAIVFKVIERYDATAAFKYALDHHLTKLPASRAKRPKH